MKNAKISTIMMSLLLGIFINNQTITYSEAAAQAAPLTAEQKNEEVRGLINQCVSNKNRNDYGGIISATRFATYWDGKKVNIEKFTEVKPDLKAKLLGYLTEACLETGDYPSVLNIMKSAAYCTDKYQAYSFPVTGDSKVILINNLAWALYKLGKLTEAINLLQSPGAKYLNLQSGKYALVTGMFAGVDQNLKADFIDTIIRTLIAIGHKEDVLDIIHGNYFNKVTLAPVAGSLPKLSSENKAALCTSIALSFDDPQKVLSLMKSAGYWNGSVFKSDAFKDLPYTYKKELVNRFETALKDTGKEKLIPALKKAAGLQ